jgi:hypothetical protein
MRKSVLSSLAVRTTSRSRGSSSTVVAEDRSAKLSASYVWLVAVMSEFIGMNTPFVFIASLSVELYS